MQHRLLILETSQRAGIVALAEDRVVIAERRLDDARRNARDLAPATAELLAQRGWRVRDLTAVIVSRGPGSYTGLRVGIMSAKMLAHAARIPLIAVDTFDAIHQPIAAAYPVVDVIADAQQDKIYVQRFGPAPVALVIVPFAEWCVSEGATPVTGPGLEQFADRVPSGRLILPREAWLPRPSGLLSLALPRLEAGDRDDPFAVEPLYLRASSAEEKWQELGRNPRRGLD